MTETNVAGALVDDSDDANTLRCHIVADTVNRFMHDYERIPSMPHLADYRARSLLDGRHVEVHAGIETFEAQVIGIDDDFTLRVRLDSGEERNLTSGEVHIPSAQPCTIKTASYRDTCSEQLSHYAMPASVTAEEDDTGAHEQAGNRELCVIGAQRSGASSQMTM